MKQCVTHHFACDCREEKTRKFFINIYKELDKLLIGIVSENSFYDVKSVRDRVKEAYEILYGTSSLQDLN